MKKNNSYISNSYTADTIFSHTMSCESLIFYLLIRNSQTIHLTFDQQRHQKATRELQKKPLTILRTPDEKIQSKTLMNILKQSTPYTTLAQSLFIKQGTQFQQQVWKLISQIPISTTQTYGYLAEKLGNKKLARAVGQACNANPLALFIPCHRVIGVSGLGGFAGGAEIKEKLLQIEQEPAFKR